MLDICYYSSDFYAPYTGISILSLCENNADLDFRLHCIDAGISEENKGKIREVVQGFGKEIVFHDFREFEDRIKNGLGLPLCNGSYATYVKIFPEMIFKGIDQILFMDGDTIIRGSIAELAEIDLENHLFAAVRVPLIYVKKFYSNPDPKDPDYLRFQYSLRFSECGYYNIGVCFVNLKKWKELDFGGRILAAQEKYPEIQQPGVNIPVDEMLFNLTLLYDIGEAYALPIPPKFNCVIHYMPYPKAVNSSMYCGYMNRRELIEAYYHADIVHFCIFKPWNTDMYSRYWPELKAYIEKSPWPHPYTQEYFVGFILKVYRRFIYPIPFNWPKAIMIPLAKMIKKRLK